MDTIKKIIIFLALVFTSAGAFAAPYSIPKDGTRRMWNEGANSWCSYINPLFNYFDATGGVLPEYPVVLGPLSVSGSGNSWLELGNNTSFTDVLTGKGGYGLLNWLPYAILNGEQKRLALFEELEAGDTSVIQDSDPTLASATGKYYSRASGDYFNVVHGVEMFAIAGTRTADETAPIIVAGADSTHDGSTPVTATMVLTELYPDPDTLLYTVTGGTPASGTWTGTYPNYSVEITPTGTDDIVVTSAGSDLAGNPAAGTKLEQELAYSGGASCDTPVYSNNATVVNSFPIGHYNYYHVGMRYNSGSPHTICSVTANMSYDYTGDASNNTYVMRIYTNSAGDLGSLVASSEGIIGSNAWNNTPVEFIFGTPPSLSANTDYWIVCNMGAAETSNIVKITTSAYNGTNSIHFFTSSGVVISNAETTPNMTIKE